MTTITLRDGVLAADSRVTNAGRVVPGAATKLYRLPHGMAAAVFGSCGAAMALVRWLEKQPDAPGGGIDLDGDDRPAIGDGRLVLVMPDGAVVLFEESSWSYEPPSEYHAWGSGAEVALGALAMGASSDRAVAIAALYDPYTGGPVETLRLPA